jgi:hypothetical protein
VRFKTGAARPVWTESQAIQGEVLRVIGKQKTMLCLLLLAIVASCASPGRLPPMQDYSEPSSGPTAIMNFLVPEGHLSEVRVIIYRNEQCTGASLAGTLNWSDQVLPEKKIPAGREFAFSMRYALSQYYSDSIHKWWCAYPTVFVPQPGKEYVAAFGAQDNKCWMRLFELKDPKKKWSRKRILYRSAGAC